MLDGIASQLGHYMDLLADRQKLVASNIANANTPGFKTKDIDFQHEFQQMVRAEEPNVITVEGLTVRNDGNNVSMDREARLLAENAIRFNLATNLLRTQIRTLRSAIKEGGAG